MEAGRSRSQSLDRGRSRSRSRSRGGSKGRGQCKRCVARIWRVFPHVALSGGLVAYAALGALVFQHIEGGNQNTDIQREYREFLGELVDAVQNHTENSSCPRSCVLDLVTEKMGKFESIWLQDPGRWTFWGSMFFCCTVFTTVGYGEIYPVTLAGKAVCVLYAMVGIPLTLVVILDVGDSLALLLTHAYAHLHRCLRSLRSHLRGPSGKTPVEAAAGSAPQRRNLDDGTLVRDLVVPKPLDIRLVLRSQADVRQKSAQLESNRAIFERLLARESLLREGPLLRTLSCPELYCQPPAPKGYRIWDLTGLGEEMETLDVPLALILLALLAYVCLGGLVLPLWETELTTADALYFCFITLTTIGFGDIIPRHPNYFMLISLFIIVGMAIMTMAFKLSQARIVGCYRGFLGFISGGNFVMCSSKNKN